MGTCHSYCNHVSNVSFISKSCRNSLESLNYSFKCATVEDVFHACVSAVPFWGFLMWRLPASCLAVTLGTSHRLLCHPSVAVSCAV